MTTTPNPTAESVILQTLTDNLKPWAGTYLASPSNEIGGALRAHGFLSEDTFTEKKEN